MSSRQTKKRRTTTLQTTPKIQTTPNIQLSPKALSAQKPKSTPKALSAQKAKSTPKIQLSPKAKSAPPNMQIVPKAKSSPKPKKIQFPTNFFITSSSQFAKWLSSKKFTNHNQSTSDRQISATVAFNMVFKPINTLQKYIDNEETYLKAMILDGNSLLIHKLAQLYYDEATSEHIEEEKKKRYRYYSFEYHCIFFNINAFENPLLETLKTDMVESISNIIQYYNHCMYNNGSNYLYFSKNNPNHIGLLICYIYLKWYYEPEDERIIELIEDINLNHCDYYSIRNLKKFLEVNPTTQNSVLESYKTTALQFIFSRKLYLKAEVPALQ